MIAAEVAADSVSREGKRLTSYKVRYPWFIHGEVMTHRLLSRNASSNRAIPLAKMLAEVESDDLRAEPVFWGGEQKGMEPASEVLSVNRARNAWRRAALHAAAEAKTLGELGVHKSLCNRLLMPFTHANVIITATEWDNFFGLRLDKAADPTMRALAEAMWAAMGESDPVHKDPGDWHLPFADSSRDWDEMETAEVDEADIDKTLIKISVARCARVSYETFEEPGKPARRSTVADDLALFKRLLGAQPMHASPAEHQATPDDVYTGGEFRGFKNGRWMRPEEHGNFNGWRQYRKMLPGESVAPLPMGYAR